MNKDYFENFKNDDKRKKLENDLLATIITESIDFNSSIEFSNCKYTDNNRISPSISHSLAKKGKNVTLFSPNLKTITCNNFSIFNTPKGYPFGIYSMIIPTKKDIINNSDIFISDENITKSLDNLIKIALYGGTSIYTMRDTNVYNLIKRCEEIRNKLNSNYNNITNEVMVKNENNVCVGALVLRKK